MSKVFLFSLTIPHSNIHTKIFCSMGKVAFRFRPSRQKKSRFHRIKSSIQICLKAWLEFHLSMYVLFAFKKSKQTIAILQEGVSGLSGKFWVGSVLLMLCSHIFTPKAFLWQERGFISSQLEADKKLFFRNLDQLLSQLLGQNIQIDHVPAFLISDDFITSNEIVRMKWRIYQVIGHFVLTIY